MTRALIFDCDGVLAQTERDGHRVAFNMMFAEFGLPVRWDPAAYAVKRRIAGGKERLTSPLTPDFIAEAGLPTDPAGQQRVAEQARDADWRLAVASTSAEPSVRAVLERAAGRDLATEFAVLAGDIVPCKKPASDAVIRNGPPPAARSSGSLRAREAARRRCPAGRAASPRRPAAARMPRRCRSRSRPPASVAPCWSDALQPGALSDVTFLLGSA